MSSVSTMGYCVIVQIVIFEKEIMFLRLLTIPFSHSLVSESRYHCLNMATRPPAETIGLQHTPTLLTLD